MRSAVVMYFLSKSFFDCFLVAVSQVGVPDQPLFQSVPLNLGHEVVFRSIMSFFHGSPIWYLSPMCFMVSLRMCTAFLSSEDCPL